MPVEMADALWEFGWHVPTRLTTLLDLESDALELFLLAILTALNIEADVDALVEVIKASELPAAMYKAQLAAMQQ